MYQLTQLADEVHRQRLAHADQRRPRQRVLALHHATRRAGRRLRRADRDAQRLRAQLNA